MAKKGVFLVICLIVLALTVFLALKVLRPPVPSTSTTTTLVSGPQEFMSEISKVQEYLSERTASGCDKIVGIKDKDSPISQGLIDSCYYNAALSAMNVSYCNPIVDLPSKRLCESAALSRLNKTQVVEKKVSGSICAQMKDRIQYELDNWGRVFDHDGKYDQYYAMCNLSKNVSK